MTCLKNEFLIPCNCGIKLKYAVVVSTRIRLGPCLCLVSAARMKQPARHPGVNESRARQSLVRESLQFVRCTEQVHSLSAAPKFQWRPGCLFSDGLDPSGAGFLAFRPSGYPDAFRRLREVGFGPGSSRNVSDNQGCRVRRDVDALGEPEMLRQQRRLLFPRRTLIARDKMPQTIRYNDVKVVAEG